MGILAAVFPDARRIRPDIAGIARCFLERWPEQAGNPVFIIHQLPPCRLQRGFCPRGICSGKLRPGLGDGIDAAFQIVRGTPGMALVIKCPAIPAAIPAGRFNMAVQLMDPVRPGICDTGVAGTIGKAGESAGGHHCKPCQPDTLALSVPTDPVHAVIPVSRADQRKVVSSPGQAFLQRPLTMIEQGLTDYGGFEPGIAIFLVRPERGGL